MGRVARSLVQAIETAELEREPCPNIYMAGIFDDAMYAELIGRLPPAELYRDIDHPDARGRDGRATRQLLDVMPHSIARMSGANATFWQIVQADLTSEAVTRALFAKLGIAERPVVAVPVLYRDREGYRIRAHTDAPYKLATLQLYLPADARLAEHGTEFHQPVDGGFRRLKKNRFLPSSGYAFMRTDASWHSVSELPPLDAPRDSLALTYYVPGYEYSSAPGYVPPEARGGR